MARKKSKPYGRAQVELHARLKSLSAKQRNKKQSARLRELNNLANRRGYADPRKTKLRLTTGVPLERARIRGYGFIHEDLDHNGWAATRSALALKWLVERWGIEVYTPLEPIIERIPDPQRGTTQATLVQTPPDGILIEDMPLVEVDKELIDIFNYKVGAYKTQLHFRWYLYNENSGEVNWWSIRGLTANPQTLVSNVNEMLRNYKGENNKYNVSTYGKMLVQISCYCQMKTKVAWLQQTKQREELKKERAKVKREGKTIDELTTRKRKTTNKKGK